MKFTTNEDIEAPIETVFEAVSNFEAMERSALRRGARVQRVGRKTHANTLISWDVQFSFRGKKRNLLAELTEFDAPNRILVQSLSGGMEGDFLIELVAHSRNRTRLSMEMEIKPKNLSARLLIQSMRLAKNKLTKRYKMRVAQYATEIENRHKSGQMN